MTQHDTRSMTEFRKIALTTGVTLNVALAGAEDAPPVILLHGFPESHRTWRDVVPLLADRFRLVMPDQRGFGGSDAPAEVSDYRIDKVVADVFALADALGIGNFALVGHDWGGAAAWAAAIGLPKNERRARIERLAIVNSPHPAIFQKSLIEDEAQRAASQYMNRFRDPGFEAFVAGMGVPAFFDRSFQGHVPAGAISAAEREAYIGEWSRPGTLTGMLNWYRASMIMVPEPGAEVAMPAWVDAPFPKVRIPTCVIWGMDDTALLPLQLDGLDAFVDDLTVVKLPGVGHFAPWLAPEAVAEALGAFLSA